MFTDLGCEGILYYQRRKILIIYFPFVSFGFLEMWYIRVLKTISIQFNLGLSLVSEMLSLQFDVFICW
jgi:hypothetical protein